jgi:hypothetical protein
MKLRTDCRFCGDVSVTGETVTLEMRPRPLLWRCSFVCPICERPGGTAVTQAAGLVLMAAGACVLDVWAEHEDETVEANFVDEAAEFRFALADAQSVETLG